MSDEKSKKQSTKKSEVTTKTDPKFQLPEEEKDQLPPFPEKDQKKGEFSESPGGEDAAEIDDLALEDVCKDIISVPFEVWHTLRKNVKPLTENEKTLIAKPLARVAQKYDVQRYMKDEFLLLLVLGISVTKRIKDSKKDDTDNNRKKGKRQDKPVQGNDPPEYRKPDIDS